VNETTSDLFFPKLRPKQLNAAAAGRSRIGPQNEKRDSLRNQLFDAVAVATLGWIERVEMSVKLSNQHDGVGAVRAFGCDDGCHVQSRVGQGMKNGAELFLGCKSF
jgi:hypothetical protein